VMEVEKGGQLTSLFHLHKKHLRAAGGSEESPSDGYLPLN